MLNKKALIYFLILTFGSTLLLIKIARLLNFTLFEAPILMSQLLILAAMFMPGISAIIVHKLILKKQFKELGLFLGGWKEYLNAYCVIVGLFVLTYSITWLFVISPDFSLTSFIKQYMGKLSDLTLPLPAEAMIVIFTIVTLIIAPLMNMIPSLGEEIGWRGFLLPHLEPLGQPKALIISGLIWGLWHTPMILILGFGYGTQMWPGVLIHLALVTGLGIWIGDIWFRTRSTVLAGFIHSVFNANAYGIWVIIFISPNKLLVGAAGLISASLWLILGLITLYRRYNIR